LVGHHLALGLIPPSFASSNSWHLLLGILVLSCLLLAFAYRPSCLDTLMYLFTTLTFFAFHFLFVSISHAHSPLLHLLYPHSNLFSHGEALVLLFAKSGFCWFPTLARLHFSTHFHPLHASSSVTLESPLTSFPTHDDHFTRGYCSFSQTRLSLFALSSLTLLSPHTTCHVSHTYQSHGLSLAFFTCYIPLFSRPFYRCCLSARPLRVSFLPFFPRTLRSWRTPPHTLLPPHGLLCFYVTSAALRSHLFQRTSSFMAFLAACHGKWRPSLHSWPQTPPSFFPSDHSFHTISPLSYVPCSYVRF